MNHYTPFDKSFSHLQTDDLVALKEVNEGWYVEYKQAIPKSQSIAKSVSAFANSYGGWLFYGIKEESKENSVAGEFLGIDSTEVDTVLQRIRQAVANLINPSCHFESKVFYGPCAQLNIEAGRAIICIAIPQSAEAPHIHSSGYIYRRIADGSEPIPETDRHMVDRLYQRSKDTINSYKKWHDEDPEFSDTEINTPFLRIMIKPNLWHLPRSDFRIDIENAREILGAKTGRTICLPFDTIYSRAGGLTARQCENNDPSNHGMTWNVNPDLTGDIIIPLSWSKGSLDQIEARLFGYEYSGIFIDALKKANIQEPHIVDLNYVYNVLMGIVEAQRALQKLAGWPLEFHLKIKLLNVWRTIPFLDIEYIINYIRRHGIPMCLTRSTTSPIGHHPNTFKYIKDHADGDDHSKAILQTLTSFIPIAQAYGLPLTQMLLDECENNETEETEETEPTFIQLNNAATRGVAITSSYNKKQ
ncbi:ATP-binding protein [Pseudomonas sp. p50]|uniref:AlbA family DNA-binding domain-containing protein n=1 Tax=Pseudomonas sp. p50(2008) TaxID=2816832 RepID=UPI00188BDCDB|nr:ATP-binding protein [Pseudomonas sp. p50(2008)]MBF4554844.1 ATP-binding protein [Pseudomonas sp. p50(2008)]